jgi:hypothetical protein
MSRRAAFRKRGCMKTARLAFLALLALLLLTVVGSGCTITIGPYDDTGEGAPRGTSVLPDPVEGPVDEPLLDEAQRARKEEADRYIAQVIYKGGEILHAVELPSGDVLDFINRDTLPALPYELPPLPFAAEDLVLPPGVEMGLTELEQIPELLALAATATPFHRPTFWPYILGDAPDATSIEDYLARYQVGGDPSSIDRLYAGLVSTIPNHGISGAMNQFRPQVAPQSFSLIEFAVYCPADGPVQELVGVVISVDKANVFGTSRQMLSDDQPRLHIEYAHPEDGQVSLDWDGMDGKFVGNPLRLHHPGQKVPVSVIGGTQVEHLMAIFQMPVTGDWWIAYNGDLLGYYPASLFTMLNGGACASAWYGEVYNPNPGDPVKTEMGSGRFAEAGLLNVAYVRSPKSHDFSLFGTEPQDDFHMIPYTPLCYDRSPLWDGVFLLGGPGGKNPGCKWP